VKFLDALVKPKRQEKRYSFDQWVNEFFTFGGSQYPLGYNTTYGKDPAEPISANFMGYVDSALKSNGVVSAVELVRLSVFSEARFQFQRMRGGRPGDLFGDRSLGVLERPWPGGTTGDLLARMILDADLAGNFYGVIVGDEIVRLRPDWVEIILADRISPATGDRVGYRRAAYAYYQGGKQVAKEPVLFLPDEVAHFAPYPDPMATYVGMSWLTPVIREIQADTQATKHKLKFFENAATPNLAVSLAKEITAEQFAAFVELMDKQHKGVENAYKTLYTAGGADVTVIGADLKQLDFKVTQGAGETRIAAAGRVHPVLAGLSEGMQGSSLNAGNFNAARRSTADGTFRPLWRNAAGSLEVLVPPPADARLWYDARDVGFLREDEKDAADIELTRSSTIAQYVREGFTAESAIAAVANQDVTLLEHTGLVSVQLQEPGANNNSTDAPVDEQPDDAEEESDGDAA